MSDIEQSVRKRGKEVVTRRERRAYSEREREREKVTQVESVGTLDVQFAYIFCVSHIACLAVSFRCFCVFLFHSHSSRG